MQAVQYWYMDTESLRQLFRAEADKLKAELQQDNNRWYDIMRRENQEMQQQIYSHHRNTMVSMMQQVTVKIDDHCSTLNARIAEIQTQVAAIKATPPTTASSSLQTRLTLSSKNSKRGQPEPDGESLGCSSGVQEWFEGWDEPHWARAYPAPSEQQAASEFGAAPSDQQAIALPVPVPYATLTTQNLSALVLQAHNPRMCMLCRRPFVHTRQPSFP